MPKIMPKDLEIIASRINQDMGKYKSILMVCIGTGCISENSLKIKDALQEELKKAALDADYPVMGTVCGFCSFGPTVIVQPQGIFYQRVQEKDIPEIIESHLIGGKPVERLMHKEVGSNKAAPTMQDIHFFRKQMQIVLRNTGMIDPENIEHYIWRGGYRSLRKALEMNPDDIIREIIASGLRGRGGGGFPTGIKWQSCKKAREERKECCYVVGNGDEGDPGAFMDRSLVETDPHLVLEGMMIGAYAVGAEEGFVYIRKEYPLATERLQIAIDQARKYGLLGHNIFGKDFSFDIHIHRGAGAFVCGESTALMASMSGKAGEPRAKYVHNVEYGYRDKPTVLNNVETWANIPIIIEKGSKWFASIGTGDVTESPWGGSTGTKIFSLAGSVKNTGPVEVPMGITLGEIIYNIGGGICDGKQFKAVQTGGPSGGFLPAELLDLKVDYDSLIEAGSMMGSGGMIVMDNRTCMVDVARYFVDFLIDESCGKCTACREGLYALSNVLNRICKGQGRPEDMELLQELSSTIAETSLCQLGGTAPNPVLSTLRYFKAEYEEHIHQKKCRAGVCKALIHYTINENCTGCTVCARKCPVDAISGESSKLHTVAQEKCIKCGICYEVCKFDAVEVG